MSLVHKLSVQCITGVFLSQFKKISESIINYFCGWWRWVGASLTNILLAFWPEQKQSKMRIQIQGNSTDFGADDPVPVKRSSFIV